MLAQLLHLYKMSPAERCEQVTALSLDRLLDQFGQPDQRAEPVDLCGQRSARSVAGADFSEMGD